MKDMFRDLPVKKLYLDERIRLLEYLNDRYSKVKASGRADRIKAVEMLIDEILDEDEEVS